MGFGEKIRYIRSRFSLTTKQLATLLHVSQSYISHVENNRRKLSRDKIVILSQKLNTPVEFFLYDEPQTLEEFESRDSGGQNHDEEDYLNYSGVVQQAVAANISPEELGQAIEFIKGYNKIHQKQGAPKSGIE